MDVTLNETTTAITAEIQSTTDSLLNNTERSGPSHCLVLKTEGIPPWEHPDNLVSAHSEEIVHHLEYAVFLPIMFLIGGPANVINMAVFYKQGLKERINVCLFSLSLVDFLYLVFNMVFNGEQIFRQYASEFTLKERYGSVMGFMMNYNLLGFFGLTWESQVISALIASERCFCILQPLRSQTVLSSYSTTAIILGTTVLNLGLYSLMTTKYRLVCIHDPVTASDAWNPMPSQFYLDNQQLVDVLDAIVFGVAIPLVMIVIVALTTAVTLVKLRQAAAWRAGTSSSGSAVSAREVSLTMMLVYNSIFFIVCVFPVALLKVVCLFIPDLNAGEPQHNLYLTFIWFIDIMTFINATFNIVVYYTMGTRYRQTFWQLMGRGRTTHKTNQNTAGTNNKALAP
ncbi:hypothetical protein ACOMHN_020350 [Nucella lapillus]